MPQVTIFFGCTKDDGGVKIFFRGFHFVKATEGHLSFFSVVANTAFYAQQVNGTVSSRVGAYSVSHQVSFDKYCNLNINIRKSFPVFVSK